MFRRHRKTFVDPGELLRNSGSLEANYKEMCGYFTLSIVLYMYSMITKIENTQ